jgi:hypothetical protein
MFGGLKKIVYILANVASLMMITGCSGLEESEKEKIRKLNAQGEYILRGEDEYSYQYMPPVHRVRDKYPWEEMQTGNQVRITREFFRCRGSSLHPAVTEGLVYKVDCGGSEQHSLPLRNGKEFIYPVLIDLVNYIQEKTGKKIVITCGHRCPAHNSYSDDSLPSRNSKHMIGAEVDFFVKGMEWNPERIINVLFQYYKENPQYQGLKEYEEFQRSTTGDRACSTPSWYNKEISVKIYKHDEGRDFDNDHRYPYLSIQVRYDRDQNEKVIYTWPKAFNGYLRY